MIPPSFSDLGKAAKDLFDKKFLVGISNVEVITKKDSRTLTVKSNHNHQTKELSGNFELKHSNYNAGVDMTLKWCTKNVVVAEISKTYERIKGLKNVGILTFEPNTGLKSLKLKDSYKREYLNFNSEFIFNSRKPDINLNAVLGCTHPKPYLTGVDLTIDTEGKSLRNHTFAVGYEKLDFGALITMKNLSLFNAYVYQKISHCVDIGVHVSHNKINKENKYGIAGQYKFPDSNDSFVKLKINQDTIIGVVYGCTLNNGVQLTLSTEIDDKKLDTGPHNFGVGFVYEQ